MKNGKAKDIPAEDILLVDDDPACLAMTALALRQEGFHVVLCSNPNAALEQLRTRPFRWLVTDAQMGAGNGFALAEAAKAIQPNLRIVMISALASDHDIGPRPIERVFDKPLALDALIAWLKTPNGGGPPGLLATKRPGAPWSGRGQE